MPKTGATRYQKFLKSEKAKTKLKAKKDLPKGTNVTKTNFKVKKIVLKEQLKKHGDNEVLSKRKLNATELLSRLNHFNIHSRTEALGGLAEIITAQPEVLEHNLGQFINGITPLVLNIEKVVRHESFKVLHIMLSNIGLEKVDPFFDVMSTYLRSAMTHIDNRIQEDSLLFLDIMLLCCSKRVAKDFHRIIPNFLDMISKLRVDTKQGRTLTVNLNSKITTVKWRVKVLYRLQQFLHKFVTFNNINELEDAKKCKTVKFNYTKENYFPLLDENSISICPLSCFSSKNAQDAESVVDEVEKFKIYADTLMPLLFETWLEVCPSGNTKKALETVINEDAAALLKSILEVISLIWDIIRFLNKKNPSSNIAQVFSQKFRQSLTCNIVKTFPYVTNIRSSKSKSGTTLFDDVITDPKLCLLNLEICYLYISLNININTKNNASETESVVSYIEKTFNQNMQETVANSVLKILNLIFCNKDINWVKNNNLLDSLFKKIIATYFSCTSTILKQKIFGLLCNISINEKLNNYHSSEVYKNWLTNLPDILLEKTVTHQTINIIHMFCVRNNSLFNNVVKSRLLDIVNNLPEIQVSDDENDQGKLKLFSLLYWIKCWDTESLNALENQLLERKYEDDHVKYIFDTIRFRSNGIFE